MLFSLLRLRPTLIKSSIAAVGIVLVTGCTTAPPVGPPKTTPVRPAAQQPAAPVAATPPLVATPAPRATPVPTTPHSVLPPASTPTPVPPGGSPNFVRASWTSLPGWRDDRVSQAWPALQASCEVLQDRSPWRAPCSAAMLVKITDLMAVRDYFEKHFTPYQIVASDGSDKGLVTGYYEPLLSGSRTPSSRFRFPLYGPPDDLLTIDLASVYPELKNKRIRGRIEGRKVVPYFSRAEIESGMAPVVGKELVYVDDPVDAFFLQIQGSGRVKLAEGGTIRLNYADQNGQPYRSIGRVLVERGELPLERASMQGIQQWGKQNAAKLPALLNENPSYVFFREVNPNPRLGIDGPIGSMGVPLLARRTIAVDNRYIPLGTPIFLATTYPLSVKPLNQLVLAQDTGGAIRGAVRADFFWGFGDEAGREAGRMKQEGRMWLLWPAGAALPAADAS